MRSMLYSASRNSYFWTVLSIFFPVILFGTISSDLNMGLSALQQIRTLMPERLSEEEFSILVDKKAFSQELKSSPPHPMQQDEIPSIKEIGCSHFYYSRFVISGEPIPIVDSYAEFEYGPYWLYPTAMHRLYDMHHATTPSSK